MAEENVEIVRRLFDAFNGRNADAMRELWTPDAEWRPAFTGGGLVEGRVYRGHAGLTEYFEMQGETWESVAADPVAIRDLGDRVLVEVHVNAVGRASGVPVDQTTWNLFEIRDRKVAAGRVYTAKAEALEAAGLSE